MSSPTVFYAQVNITCAASPTDILVLTGAANTIVRLRKFSMTATATSNQPFLLTLIKRSADNTGGTRAAVTPVDISGRGETPNALLAAYSANPASLGAAVGNIAFSGATSGVTATSRINPQVILPGDDFIVINPGEVIAANVTSGGGAGLVVYTNIVWDEG